MSKEDRYAHLGEQADDEQTGGQGDDGPTTGADDAPVDGVRVTITDGDETAEVTVEEPGVSVADLEALFVDGSALAAVGRDDEAASGDGDVSTGEDGESSGADGVASTAVEHTVQASTFLPRMALQSSSRGLARGLDALSPSDRNRDD